MNSNTLVSSITSAAIAPAEDRQRLADRLFRITVGVNVALTLFAALAAFTGFGARIAGKFELNIEHVWRLLFAVLFFNVLWALIWYGVKNALLKFFVGMTRDDRREVFSSRMSQPFDLTGLLGRYSERRIRIVDMIGRRGRFITLAMAVFYFLYMQIATNRAGPFTTGFTAETLLDAVIVNWLFIALFYSNGFLGAVF